MSKIMRKIPLSIMFLSGIFFYGPLFCCASIILITMLWFHLLLSFIRLSWIGLLA